MDGENGTFEEVSLSTFSWKFEHKDFTDICYSKCFSFGDKNNVFYFELYPKNEGSVYLSLWQMRGSIPKCLRMLILLNYKSKQKSVLYQNNNLKAIVKECERGKAVGLYDLTTIKTNGLLGIKCISLNNEECRNPAQETDSDDEYYYEDSDDERIRKDNDHEHDEKESDNEQDESFGTINPEKYRVGRNGNELTTGENAYGLIALSENLKSLFLDEVDSDVILKVGDKKYPAHKVIIKTRSSVFQAMMTHDMIEKNQGVVDIVDCDPYIFQDFLLYLYAGKLDNITHENVFELYHISDKYDVKELRMDCIEFIINNLNADIICDAISLAVKYSERVLLNVATIFFIDNAKDILTTVKWQQFVKENPVEANELFIKTLNKDYPVNLLLVSYPDNLRQQETEN